MDPIALLRRNAQPVGGIPDAAQNPEPAPRADQEKLYCAACGNLVTYGRWRIAMNGGHEHTVFNPAGVVFTIQCFRDAVGAMAVGRASGSFTWFKGYSWRISVCAACGTHLGWRYAGATLPSQFHGFIKNRLTVAPPPEGST